MTMNATEIVLPGIGEPETLQVRTRELPEPGPGQVVVRVEATGVSFAEQQMRRGKYYDQPPFPFVPGYDLVGVVERSGAGGPAVGQRVAALTKTGGWADRVVLDAADLVPVPAGVEPAAAETVVVNGVTAWRMLHRAAKVRPGQTIVVLGAAGGVGSTLVQLARHAGIRVIGTAGAAAPRAPARARRDPGRLPHRGRPGPRPRARARTAWPPSSTTSAARASRTPGGCSPRGGTLVSYGTASTRDAPGNPRLPVLKLLARLTAWNLLPNGRRATFFNLWAGRRLRPARYRAELRQDLTAVLRAARRRRDRRAGRADVPAHRRGGALRFAEAGGITGKVVLVPQPALNGS